MSADLLFALQEAHAFDPFPVRDDLGVYHVPFAELSGDDDHLEQSLGDGCRRYERIAIVGESGTGKSSLTASVLGPLAEGLAPIVVPVAIEPNETVSEPRAMFAHIAAVIARAAEDAAALSSSEREEALARLTAQRPVGRVGGRSVRLGIGWMGANVSTELVRQAAPGSIARSAAETLEVVEQMLATIHGEGLAPVLVFDDTDRWLSGSFRDPEDLARSFFGRVLPALAELRCSVVVAVHRRYLADDALQTDIHRVLETVLELPTLRDATAVGAVLESRVHAHRPDDDATLADVITDDAVRRLFELYRSELRGELRGVLRTAHVALADACDGGADAITTPVVDAAYAAWDSS